MDRRSSYPYPTRSKPSRNYAEDDDDDGDDDIFGETNYSDDDEEYNGHHRRVSNLRSNHPTHHPNKQRRFSSGNYQFTSLSGAPNWSEHATFVLLEIWGERFLQLGRSSLRSEDWNDVAERVSDATRMKISVLDCRNRLNALKTKYNREKAKVVALGGGNSKWVYFKKMDVLMTMSPRQLQQQELCGLACGMDSGEFVFMNPRVYLDQSNALDEMKDSPVNSESEEDEEEQEGEEEVDEDEEESYRMLSESIKRVREIYERIEDSKRQHMMELERMRMEFQRELELQKKEMIDRTRDEIAKLSQGNEDDGEGEGEGSDFSAENVSE